MSIDAVTTNLLYSSTLRTSLNFLFDIVQFYSVQINLNVHLELVAKPKGLNKKEGALLETRDSRGTRVGIRNVGPCVRARIVRELCVAC